MTEMELQNSSCCGLMEIRNLSNFKESKQAMQAFCEAYFEEDEVTDTIKPIPGAYVLFTGVTKYKYGQKFKRFIRRHRLGDVIETKSTLNTNSDNYIKAWIWSVRRGCLRRWREKYVCHTSS